MVSQVTHKDKLNRLQRIMIRYAEQKKKPLPNGSGHKWVLTLERKSELSAQDKQRANKLFRTYLGWV